MEMGFLGDTRFGIRDTDGYRWTELDAKCKTKGKLPKHQKKRRILMAAIPLGSFFLYFLRLGEWGI